MSLLLLFKALDSRMRFANYATHIISQARGITSHQDRNSSQEKRIPSPGRKESFETESQSIDRTSKLAVVVQKTLTPETPCLSVNPCVVRFVPSASSGVLDCSLAWLFVRFLSPRRLPIYLTGWLARLDWRASRLAERPAECRLPVPYAAVAGCPRRSRPEEEKEATTWRPTCLKRVISRLSPLTCLPHMFS